MTMKPAWINYPIGLFAAAMGGTVGAILSFAAALSIGTQLGLLVLGEERVPLLMLPVTGFLIAALACLQGWGLLYVLFLGVMLHRVVFRDAPLLPAAWLVAVLQTLATIAANSFFDHWYYQDGEFWIRILFVYGGYAAVFAAGWWMRRRYLKTMVRSR